jgi:hypothetical protein
LLISSLIVVQKNACPAFIDESLRLVVGESMLPRQRRDLRGQLFHPLHVPASVVDTDGEHQSRYVRERVGA